HRAISTFAPRTEHRIARRAQRQAGRAYRGARRRTHAAHGPRCCAQAPLSTPAFWWTATARRYLPRHAARARDTLTRRAVLGPRCTDTPCGPLTLQSVARHVSHDSAVGDP